MKDICAAASDGVQIDAVANGARYWFRGECRGDNTTVVCCEVIDGSGGDPTIADFWVRGTDQADDINLQYTGGFDMEPLATALALAAFAEGGNDHILGSRSSDPDYDETLMGSGGNDDIRAEPGDDLCYGGAGTDYIQGAAGDDVISGGEGGDWLNGDGGSDQIDGNQGGDRICDHEPSSVPSLGDPGTYTFSGCSTNGTTGNDVIDGGPGNDRIYASGGTDTCNGGDDDDWIDDTEGSGLVDGDAGADVVCSGKITGPNGTDIGLLGGTGSDVLVYYGNNNNWYIDGESPTSPNESDQCYPSTPNSFDCSLYTQSTCPTPSN